MGCCKCVCKGVTKFFCGLFLFLCTLTALLSVPAIDREYWRAVEKYICPDVVPLVPEMPASYIVFFLLGQLKWLITGGPNCAEAFIRFPEAMTSQLNAFDGPGLLYTVGNLGGYALVRNSHQANKDVLYDPDANRVEDVFIGMNTTLVGNYFAPGVMPTLLQLGTSDPRWWSKRDLITATIPATAQVTSDPNEFKFPKLAGVTEENFCKNVDGWDVSWSGIFKYQDPMQLTAKELTYVACFELFKISFGVELTIPLLDQIIEYQGNIGLMAVGPSGLPQSFFDHGRELQDSIEAAVMKSEWSKKFLAEAKKRGMDGPGELRSLLASWIVAGGTSPGTALMSQYVITQIDTDRKKMVPLFKKDPESFILEAARLFGGGGANANIQAKKDTTWTLGSGRVVEEKKGTYSMTSLLVAGRDPNVWGGPSKDPAYAAKFDSDRANKGQVMAFMNEYEDIKKCSNVTGCAAAPRFCPGTFLVQRLARNIANWYLDNCRKGTSKDEM